MADNRSIRVPLHLSAYKVRYPGATREHDELSWGHVQIFRTVAFADTLVRRFADIQPARPCPVSGQPITAIPAEDVQQWFVSLRATPVAADRSAPALSVIMCMSQTYGCRSEGSDPCRGIKRYRRRGRERCLSHDEMCRPGDVLKRHQDRFPLQTAIVGLLLLTGCRKSEIPSLN